MQGFLREQSTIYVKDEETEWRGGIVTNGYVADEHEDKLVREYGWTKLESAPENWEETKVWLREHLHPSLYFVSTNNRRYAPHLGFKYAKDAAAFKLVWL